MAFGSNRYFKPGKGVAKDEPEKKSFFKFFELYGRKFWRFILINLIYFAVLLPFILYLYATAYDAMYYVFVAMGFTPEQVEQVWTPMLYLTTLYYTYLPQPVTTALLVLSILAYGPCRAGVTYVIRNFTQEQHAWTSDLWDKAKENWKQGVLFGLIDMGVFFLFVYNMSYQPDPSTGMVELLRVSKYVSVLAVVLYCFMRKYIFLMIVTVRLKFTALVKNAWLLMMIGIFRNVGTALVNLALWVLLYALVLLVHPIIEVLFLPFLIFAFTNDLSIFACYPLIDKYLVQAINELSEEQRAELMKLDENRERKQSAKAAKKQIKQQQKDQYYNS